MYTHYIYIYIGIPIYIYIYTHTYTCIYIYIYTSGVLKRHPGQPKQRPTKQWHRGNEVSERNQGSKNHAEQRKTKVMICRGVLRTNCQLPFFRRPAEICWLGEKRRRADHIVLYCYCCLMVYAVCSTWACALCWPCRAIPRRAVSCDVVFCHVSRCSR